MRGTRPPNKLLALSLATAAALALSFAPTSSETPRYLPTANSHPIPHSALYTPHSVAEAAPVSTNSSNLVYFRQTGHYVKDAFLNYWLMHGGVALYGYPISEEFTKDGVAVQYFERSRFEYRPNSTRPWKVELTSVGS